MPTYTPLVTLAGQAKIAASIADGPAIVITQLAVGDANGATLTPLETMTALTHEVDRVSVSGAVRDGADPTKVIVSAVLPVDNGPYTIREVAIFTDDGQLFAIGAYPETFKPTPAQGVAVEVDVQFIIKVSAAANVVIGIDPTNLFGIDKMLRVPFIGIDQHLINTPPGAPALGALYTVGPSPTGAWIGLSNKLAQWNGSFWLIADAPERTVVGDKASAAYYRRTASGWLSFDPDTANQGLARLATTALMTAGVEPVKVVTPALSAAQNQAGSWEFAADTGSADALALVLTPTPAALTDGMRLWIEKAVNPNASTTPTLTVATGAGPVTGTIVNKSGGALAAGDLPGSARFCVTYKVAGNKFRVAGMLPSEANVSISNVVLGLANKFRNATCQIAQRGPTGSVSAGTSAYGLDGHIVGAAGAAVVWAQAAQLAGAGSPKSLQITGQAGVTDVFWQQRIESIECVSLAGQKTAFQVKILNNSGAALTPLLTVKHAGGADDWSAPSIDVAAAALQVCPDGAVTTVSYIFPAHANSGNGLEFTLDFGGALNGAGKNVRVADFDARASDIVRAPELLPYALEMLQCQRYLPGIAPGSLGNCGPGGLFVDATSGAVTLPFYTPSRANVTGLQLSSLGHFAIAARGLTYLVSNWTFNGSSRTAGSINFFGAAGITGNVGEFVNLVSENLSAWLVMTGAEL